MSTISEPRTVVRLHHLQLATHQPVELLDITESVAAVVRQARVREGFAHVFVRHTTAAVRIQEREPLLLDDLRRFLARLAPADDTYGHNDFRVRTHHMHPDERPNGHAHCQGLLLSSSVTLNILHGE
ncbi:MAG: secondary thiamine-phosphate synthase enzyme YjbQ, partial [Chloroflexota bacterium]|nr:secondary thiamine-phosphate synthase enzyme YjbQ [Chloroflexota bacterium]